MTLQQVAKMLSHAENSIGNIRHVEGQLFDADTPPNCARFQGQAQAAAHIAAESLTALRNALDNIYARIQNTKKQEPTK